MEIRNLTIQEDAPEDVVQFVKHLEENLDPNNEYNCEITIETTTNEKQDLIGDDVPIRGKIPERVEYGVRTFITFTDNKEVPSHQLSQLASTFYGDNISFQARFDGESGVYEAFVFETID